MATKIKIENLTPATAIHPGEMLSDELESRQIKQKDFADLLGILPSQLNEIVNGKRGVNTELALLIGKALNMEPAIWLNLQANYELDAAKANKKVQSRLLFIDQWQMLQQYIPEKFFRKLGYIKGNPSDDIATIKSIYNVEHFEQLAGVYSQSSYVRLRKSPTLEIDKKNLIAWIKTIDYEASKISLPKFNQKSATELIGALRDVFWKNKDTVSVVSKTLKAHGIKLIIIENPEKCPIDGCAFWNEGNPSIGLSLRHKRIDNLAFTLFHELGHVLLHLVSNNKAEFVDVDTENTTDDQVQEEQEADGFARDSLINPDSWSDYLKSPTKSQEKSMINFARKERIHPAIIKGRLSHELKNYRIKTRFDHNIY